MPGIGIGVSPDLGASTRSDSGHGAESLGALVVAGTSNQTMHASGAPKVGAVVVAGSAYGWAPTDVAGLTLWIHGDAGITLNSGNVSAWNDQSSNAHNFTQATTLKQPLFVSGGLNGHGTVRFAGGLSANAHSLGTASFALAQPNDIWIVYKNITHVTNSVIFCDQSTSAFPEIFQGSSANAVSLFAGSTVGPDTNQTNNVWAVARFQINGSSSSITVGNHTATTGNAGANGTTTGFQLAQFRTGGISVSNGNIEIAELFIYPAILGASDAAAAKAYLQTKYSSATA